MGGIGNGGMPPLKWLTKSKLSGKLASSTDYQLLCMGTP